MSAATDVRSLAERYCREFAAMLPTAEVRKGLRAAEAGEVTWGQLYRLYSRALAAADQIGRD